MNNYKYLCNKIRIDDLKPNTIYWFGTDGLFKWASTGKSWKEIYDDLLDHNIIHDDRMIEEYYDEQTEELRLPDNFDYKEYIRAEDGNAYYQAYTLTDNKGNRAETCGDLNWFNFLRQDNE